MKRTIAEFLTGLGLFASIIFCYGASATVTEASAIAGASVVFEETIEEATEMSYVGVLYSVGNVNVRKEPSVDSDVVCTLVEYEPIKVWSIEGSNWYKTKSGYYIRRDMLIPEKDVPDSVLYSDLWATFKSYTDYRALTATGSPQYALQQRAYTGDYGLRMVDGRYCCALGSRFSTTIGQKFDIILYDGTIIPCVLCDQKSDRHTDPTHTYTTVTGTNCATEFYVESGSLYSAARNAGDLSEIPGWDSGVVAIRVYNAFV